jgi:hypothetical protein
MTATECADAVNEAFKDLGLLRSTQEAIAAVPLPLSSKEFLLTGGLPIGTVFGFDFQPIQILPMVRQYAAARGYPSVGGDLAEARCIGDSWGVLMILRAGAWDVRWIDTSDEHGEMFVNSNVESLGASLAAYASLAPLRGKRELAELSAHFEQMLRRIDPPCVEGWWSTVVQEVGFGLS